MSIEFNRLSKLLAREGHLQAADELVDLALSLMERNLIPENLNHSPELGVVLNELVGSGIDDNI